MTQEISMKPVHILTLCNAHGEGRKSGEKFEWEDVLAYTCNISA